LENKARENLTPIAVSIADGAKLIGVGRSRLYLEIRSKSLPTYKVGGRRLVRPVDLSAWLEKHAAN
jgi:excisionase family DNA binding protein